MKVCYLIQTHKNPDQIYRLVRTIGQLSPDSQIIISHDVSGCKIGVPALEKIFGTKVLLTEIKRGGFSLVQGYLDAIEWLLNSGIEFDWLIDLTGQDYPTQPLAKIEKFFAETSYDGFLEYFPVFSPESHWKTREGYTRYFYKYRQIIGNLPEWQKPILNSVKIINYLQPFFRINFSYGLMLGVPTKPPFTQNFACYGGSLYCSLSRKCVRYLYDFYQSQPEIVNYYRTVSNPDESFIQTVLVNSGLFKLSADNKRYFDFSRTQNGHPRILTIDDYPSLVRDSIHFARKFDLTKDSKILDMLDRRITRGDREIFSQSATI